ncbi:ribosome biogenesis protein [Candidatus Nitrosopelagicus sp.]|nr:ribosome biogenesis protein [Candidatus Nitrosopelagicus sp.]
MLTLILTQSSLEIVPSEIQNHPSVTSYCKRNKKKSSEVLLDNSWHFAAMKGISNEIKRGRPDIIHLALLAICSTPLYQQKKIKVFVHTINNQVITLGDQIRLPKSYHRFQGIIEKLFKEKKIELSDLKLMELQSMTFEELLNKIKPEKVVGFSTEGKNSTFEESAKTITDNTCIVVGGFQKGHFEENIKNKFDQIEKLSQNSLETHVILSRIIYEYEKTIFM